MSLEDFTTACMEALIWSGTVHVDETHQGGGDYPAYDHHEPTDFTNVATYAIERDCAVFYRTYNHLFGGDDAQAGHDFALTRNRHGAGFWDRPDVYGDDGSKVLTEAANKFKEITLFAYGTQLEIDD